MVYKLSCPVPAVVSKLDRRSAFSPWTQCLNVSLVDSRPALSAAPTVSVTHRLIECVHVCSLAIRPRTTDDHSETPSRISLLQQVL